MSCRKTFLNTCLVVLVIVVIALPSTPAFAQAARPEQVQIAPPPVRGVDAPGPDASALQLERQADGFRADKLYLDALDYYRAALARKDKDKEKDNESRVLNKIGITELLMQRYKEAKKSFERSIHMDATYADAYNNLGVIYYETKKYGAAVKEYEKAIAHDNASASFYSNLGAAYFSKRAFEPAVVAYQHALELDPDVFVRTSRAGVQAQLPSPADRARYDYTVAKLYAKMGLSDRSIEYLRKAMEEGYRDLKSVYKDVEFAELRKSPRFSELMALNTRAIPN
jgi:tetratricopeptide (TPR) repeat protein